MNQLITEDIIKRALDESIEEFILEEGEGWNSFKKWAGNKFGNIGNAIKNGIAMYMDAKTNGQWNRKYNKHVKGNGNVVGFYYFEKWLQIHYYRLQDIVYGNEYGNAGGYFYAMFNNRKQMFRHDSKNNVYIMKYNNYIYKMVLDHKNIPYSLSVEDYTGNKIADCITPIQFNRVSNSYEITFRGGYPKNFNVYYMSYDDTTPEEYILSNCTKNSFLKYTQNTLGKGEMRDMILKYIEYIQKTAQENNNYDEIIELFTSKEFHKWYLKNRNNISNTNNASSANISPYGNFANGYH